MSLIDGFDSLSFSVDGVVTKVVLMCVDVALKKALDFFFEKKLLLATLHPSLAQNYA